jgi:hypothetical protein
MTCSISLIYPDSVKRTHTLVLPSALVSTYSGRMRTRRCEKYPALPSPECLLRRYTCPRDERSATEEVLEQTDNSSSDRKTCDSSDPKNQRTHSAQLQDLGANVLRTYDRYDLRDSSEETVSSGFQVDLACNDPELLQ